MGKKLLYIVAIPSGGKGYYIVGFAGGGGAIGGKLLYNTGISSIHVGCIYDDIIYCLIVYLEINIKNISLYFFVTPFLDPLLVKGSCIDFIFSVTKLSINSYLNVMEAGTFFIIQGFMKRQFLKVIPYNCIHLLKIKAFFRFLFLRCSFNRPIL